MQKSLGGGQRTTPKGLHQPRPRPSKIYLKRSKNMKKGTYGIVRTYSAGCFAGELISEIGREVTLKNARRLWYWEGASSLSQLAQEGTSKPDQCKFPVEVTELKIYEATEMLAVTDIARKSIKLVKIWAQ